MVLQCTAGLVVLLGTCSDGSGLYWLQLPAPLTCRASGSMESNTTAIPADAIWLSAAVRGPLEVFGCQSLAFSPGMSTGARLGQAGAWTSLQCDYLLTSCPCRCCLTTTRVSSAHKATRVWGRRLVAKAPNSRAWVCMPRSGC